MSAVLPPTVPDGAAGEADAPPATLDAPLARVAVWDLPTRLFHWSLVAAVSAAIATGLIGGNAMVWHGRAGLATCGLLAFRVVWGVVGGTHARFASFVPGPRRLIAYLRGRWRGHGHNPLGALSVLALLALLTAQVATGLVGNDEIAFTGPLAGLVDEQLSLRSTGLHHALSNALYAWLGLHLGAIAWHRIAKRERLVEAMVTGGNAAEVGDRAPRRAGAAALLSALGIAAGAVYAASGAWIAAPASSGAAAAITPAVPTAASAPTW